ncbi:MAG: lysine 2,3-aminomutase, partial [Gemmatimonadota bacterium]
GISEIKGQKIFVLNFLQGRNPGWVGKPFFAKYNSDAVWIDELEPAFGESKFFFDEDYYVMQA